MDTYHDIAYVTIALVGQWSKERNALSRHVSKVVKSLSGYGQMESERLWQLKHGNSWAAKSTVIPISSGSFKNAFGLDYEANFGGYLMHAFKVIKPSFSPQVNVDLIGIEVPIEKADELRGIDTNLELSLMGYDKTNDLGDRHAIKQQYEASAVRCQVPLSHIWKMDMEGFRDFMTFYHPMAKQLDLIQR